MIIIHCFGRHLRSRTLHSSKITLRLFDNNHGFMTVRNRALPNSKLQSSFVWQLRLPIKIKICQPLTCVATRGVCHGSVSLDFVQQLCLDGQEIVGTRGGTSNFGERNGRSRAPSGNHWRIGSFSYLAEHGPRRPTGSEFTKTLGFSATHKATSSPIDHLIGPLRYLLDLRDSQNSSTCPPQLVKSQDGAQ